MNFLHVLNKIVQLAGTAVPVVTLVNPAIGIILGSVVTMIVTIQGQIPDEPGHVKKAAVMKVANDHAASAGVILDQNRLSSLIDGFVTVLKADTKVTTEPTNLGKQ